MAHEQITLRTADGECPAHVLTPKGEGPWPGAIFFMDGLAIRQTLIDMAQRLADGGYVVLLPDMFYRFGPYQPLVPKEIFQKDYRPIIGPMMATTDNARAGQDTQYILVYLASRLDVRGPGVGTVGFCMGGGMSLTAAGTYPDRVAAAASFHGGNLANESPMSPHLLAPRMKAEVYVAGADNDQSYPPEMEARLDKALTDAGVRHRCEIYPGAAHGWMKPDFPVYDEAAAERGWVELFALFERNLRGG
jgi:carboxymethylenebutenolidase